MDQVRSIGGVIAVVVLVLAIVLAVTGGLSPLHAGMFGALAISRLV